MEEGWGWIGRRQRANHSFETRCWWDATTTICQNQFVVCEWYLIMTNVHSSRNENSFRRNVHTRDSRIWTVCKTHISFICDEGKIQKQFAHHRWNVDQTAMNIAFECAKCFDFDIMAAWCPDQQPHFSQISHFFSLFFLARSFSSINWFDYVFLMGNYALNSISLAGDVLMFGILCETLTADDLLGGILSCFSSELWAKCGDWIESHRSQQSLVSTLYSDSSRLLTDIMDDW